MTKDYSQVIGSLRDTAIGRCRERLNAASKRVQGLVNDPPDENMDGGAPCGGREHYGVTSVLKKRHGL
ncbi:MAG TPA: hypothetical protein P5217_01690 [Methanoregulaceae archaeon]|nr:hypothetical protein [Methanoregulaceae archaeon]HPD75208.1 hypothetical protein [Methanoregulaceae archaeon]HRY74973.1 hypothetical protein [Methanoregulaceae archaeon]